MRKSVTNETQHQKVSQGVQRSLAQASPLIQQKGKRGGGGERGKVKRFPQTVQAEDFCCIALTEVDVIFWSAERESSAKKSREDEAEPWDNYIKERVFQGPCPF